MRRRDAFLHLGPSRLGTDLLHEALDAQHDVLTTRGVRRVGTPDAAFRAAVELGRDHRAWGFRRREVEGAWAGLCRDAQRDRRRTRAVLVSERLLAGLRPPQVDLMLDQLAGFRPHVVLTASAPDAGCTAGDPGTDLVDVLDRWAPAVGDPARIHVLVVPPGPRERARLAVWRAFGEVAGLDDLALRVPAAWADGADGADEEPVAATDPGHREEEHARLTGLALTWIGALAASGHDVRGDLADLLPAPPHAAGSSRSGRPGGSVRLPGVLVRGA